jgi:hypothetical protein
VTRPTREKLEATVRDLSETVRRLEARLQAVESQGAPAIGGEALTAVRGRRDVLKLAGAGGLLAAAGALAIRPLPAAATTGTMQFGTTNTEDTVTKLTWTTGVTSTTPSTQQAMQGAMIFFGQDGNDGVDGYAAGSLGYGVSGQTDAGYGVVGAANTGVDLAALGTGRIQARQAGAAGAPTGYNVPAGRLELVPDSRGKLYAGVNGSGAATWRPLSSIVPITPIRIVDTRSNTGTAGSGLSSGQALQPGQAYTFGPFNLGTSVNGISATAVGLVGNVTAIGMAGQGFFIVYPAGSATPNVSTVNFSNAGGTVFAVGNAFTVGFGTGGNAGKVTVFCSNNVAAHCTLDVFGYIE